MKITWSFEHHSVTNLCYYVHKTNLRQDPSLWCQDSGWSIKEQKDGELYTWMCLFIYKEKNKKEGESCTWDL